MADPLLEFRALDLLANGIRLQLTIGYSEPVEVVGKDFVVPHLSGRIQYPRRADVRKLRLEGNVSGLTPEAWRIATDMLAEVIDTRLDAGELIMRAPYLGLATGTVATINARTVNAVSGPIRAKLLQHWSIELESIDPDWTVDTA